MKRNSTLLGLVIGLVIGLILCVILYMFLSKTEGTIVNKDKNEYMEVCVLKKAIKSGTGITSEDIITKSVNRNLAPTDATTKVINGIAKIDLSAGTVLGTSMLSTNEETLTSDLREQEYNMITLPTQLAVNDFIDIRLQLPNGGDYIVISKKKVLNCNSSTIWLSMTEEEILTMSNAIIEYYIMAGSKLYATKYTDPGSQEKSTPTYCPNSDVEGLIRAYKKAGNEQAIFSDIMINMRNNNINPAVRQYNESAITNIEQNIQKEIENLKESREAYFGALNSAY